MSYFNNLPLLRGGLESTDAYATVTSLLSTSTRHLFESKTSDEVFMNLAIQAARRAESCVLPNPKVGALITYGDKIVGEGFHSGPGQPHAEVEAIRDAESKGFHDFSKATLYCSLEPCSHVNKRTPPCAPIIASKNFKRVVIAHQDPNPLVSGRGIEIIRAAGIDVCTGCLQSDAETMNQAFLKNQIHRLPYITLKIALTFDGKMADDKGKSQWITGEPARHLVHRLRSQADSLGVGSGTIDADDPQLNVRLPSGNLQRKIVIFGNPKARVRSLRAAKANGLENIIQIPSKKSLKTSLRHLYRDHKICHLFIEGGAGLASSFLEKNLVDELVLIYGRGIVGGVGKFSLLRKSKRSLGQTISFTPHHVELLGSDVIMRGLKNVYRSH